MGYANNMITGPVSVYDVQRCFGTSRNDVGDLIANVAINKWAKYKPVRTPVIDTVTGQWNANTLRWLSGASWWKADGMCGLSTVVASEFGDPETSTSFAYKLIHGQLGWSYNRPGGGASQPYRLQDFASYNHLAQQPYGDIGSTTIYLDQYGAGQIDWEVLSFNDDTNLQLSDFSIPNPAGGTALHITDFFLGLILYNSSRLFLFTSSTKFSSGASLSVAISNMRSYAGTWNCMPFFTRDQVNAQGGFDANGVFVSLADITPISVTLLTHGSNYFDYIDGEWNSGGTAVSYDLQIKNETSTAHSYSTITLSIYKDTLTSNPVATKTITNTTVNANSTVNLTGTISVSKQDGSVYWITVVDNTSGSTIPSINNQVEEYGGM